MSNTCKNEKNVMWNVKFQPCSPVYQYNNALANATVRTHDPISPRTIYTSMESVMMLAIKGEYFDF